ncbi:DUF1223 domain-containing protein [Bradyrhizobium sp. LHD-71]|uniref:DUF1223 domain-containing protein n=1 Tax=Bradyrhizobium sp. LHD-71 TaxID=3072141 RepID=UPI00280DB76D|nr:DUF1223 domain-containing protein [Bradyrhizobium sp. LHD-71]MDQ8729560.1 DUF1223 domain-containing protein [Bradyrhizobium sp. LHD-71]
MSVAVAAGVGLLFATPSAAAEPRAVLELFTAQGCSSCPEADKLIGEIAKDPTVIAISLPIDYWDYLGWKDTLADPKFTARQKAYSKVRGDRQIYTPQVVVNGQLHALGNDRASIDRAISESSGKSGVMSVPVKVSVAKGQIKVSVPESPSGDSAGEVWICSVAEQVPVAIGRGENRGKEITYHNVVRNWLKVGDWTGKPATWTVPIENLNSQGVDGAVVYIQEGSRERPGAMLGAAYSALR